MTDWADVVRAICDADEPVAVATVVATRGSAPFGAGTVMMLTATHGLIGSVSVGCVEGAVLDALHDVRDGGPPRLITFGFSDDDAFAVGLTCGGSIDVFVQRVTRTSVRGFESAHVAAVANRPVAIIVTLDGPGFDAVGQAVAVLNDRDVDAHLRGRLADRVKVEWAAGSSAVIELEGRTVFVSSHQSPARLLIFGAHDFSAALATFGTLLGFEVTVCDGRPAFSLPHRSPDADHVVADWPHRHLGDLLRAGAIDRRTVICSMIHDPKFEIPMLSMALELRGKQRPAYIGSLGSLASQGRRREQLLAVGVAPADLSRLRGPIGIDLGGRSAAEVALSVMAEVVAVTKGGSARPLSAFLSELSLR